VVLENVGQHIFAGNFLTSCRNFVILYTGSNVYNMSGRVVSDVQTRAEGERNDSSYEFIGEVILKINIV
jgi:hypothetical protein